MKPGCDKQLLVRTGTTLTFFVFLFIKNDYSKTRADPPLPWRPAVTCSERRLGEIGGARQDEGARESEAHAAPPAAVRLRARSVGRHLARAFV